jgi:hypothetical protein
MKAGEMMDINWMDIFIEIKGLDAHTQEGARALLQLNQEMSSVSPIPRWFSTNKRNEAQFLHRMDWQDVPAQALDRYIVRILDFIHGRLSRTPSRSVIRF